MEDYLKLRSTCWSISDITTRWWPPALITPPSSWASSEWLTCSDGCLPVMYVSDVLPQKWKAFPRVLSHMLTSHSEPWLSWNQISPKNTAHTQLNSALACELCGSQNPTRHVHLPQIHSDECAPHWTHHLLFIFQLPLIYVGDEENSMPALFHMSAWICVYVWSLHNLVWQVEWAEQNLPELFGAWLC